MGKTIAEKILGAHSGRDVRAGEIAICRVDLLMGQDGTSPLAIKAFAEMGGKRVFCSRKICMVIDHNSPSPSQEVSGIHTMMREFARKHKITLYDVGCGVCHQIMVEENVLPGMLVLGADSHTTTYGTLNAFSTGVGSTDLAAAMISGRIWLKVPQTIRIVINGKLPRGVYSKDIILYIIGRLGSDGANYRAVEFAGSTISRLSVDSRFTISNMSVEMGAKAGLMEVDKKTVEWLKENRGKSAIYCTGIKPDRDAIYEKILEYNVSRLEPQVSKPHAVDKVVPLRKVEGTKIDQVLIGTCTNGRFEDLKVAADILKGRRVFPGLKVLVVPASRRIFLQAVRTGVIETFVRSGAAVLNPGCGPCVGTHQGIPADGEVVLSTANRNFRGRMANPDAFIYLCSPATAAASAITGKITDPREFV